MNDLDTFGADETPTSGGSTLRARLRDRRKAAAGKTIDLELPDDPTTVVRYKPVTQALIDSTNKRWEKSKAPDKAVVINAVILASVCVGVFSATAPEDVLTLEDLRAVYELPEGTSTVEVIRALYELDGAVMSTAVKLGELSGYSLEEIEEHLAGN